MPEQAHFSDTVSLKAHSTLRRIASMGPKARASIDAVLDATNFLGRTELTDEQRRHLVVLADDNAVLVHILNSLLDLVDDLDNVTDGAKPAKPYERSIYRGLRPAAFGAATRRDNR